MATEEGLILKLEGADAWIKTTRSVSCKSCASRSACNTLGGGNDMEVKAINTANAQPGDKVMLQFKTSPLLKAVFLLYVFPIICLLIGSIIGQEIAKSHDMNMSAVSAALGFTCFFVAIGVVKLRSNQLVEKKEYQPEVIRVIGHQQL